MRGRDVRIDYEEVEMGLIRLMEEKKWGEDYRLDFNDDIIEKVLRKLEMIDDGADKDKEV